MPCVTGLFRRAGWYASTMIPYAIGRVNCSDVLEWICRSDFRGFGELVTVTSSPIAVLSAHSSPSILQGRQRCQEQCHISSCTVQVIIGVDTHKDQHVAVAIDARCPTRSRARRRLRVRSSSGGPAAWDRFTVRHRGHRFLRCWARTLDRQEPCGRRGGDRSVRYRKGKSDPKMAARSVLAGVADAIPKSRSRDDSFSRVPRTRIKARTQAVNQMKALVVTAPAELRETLAGLTTIALITRSSSGRPQGGGEVHTSIACPSVDSMKRFRSWRSS